MFDLPPRLGRHTRTLLLPTRVLAVMQAEGWNAWPLETGGILLGRPSSTGAEVTTLIGPGPGATHHRYAFTPDADWQAERVAAYWRADPTVHYLGDWHTHPGGTTKLSSLDHETARAIAAHPPARQASPFMLVTALREDASSRLAAAQLREGRLRPVVLKICDSPTAVSRP